MISKSNPYRNVFGKGTNEVVPGETKLPAQDNPFTDKHGEINASSQADLLVQIGNALKASESAPPQPRTTQEASTERAQALSEAMNDETGRSLQMLGQALGAEIYETTNRQGFARRVVQYQEVGQGETNLVTVKEKNVMGFMAVSPTEVMPSEIRERRILPPEFHLSGYILIDTIELANSSSDLLEEKYEEGLEQVMVKEDRLFKRMADSAVGIRNTVQNFSTFTPAVFARMLNQVSRWGIPTTTCLLSSNLWEDVIQNGDFNGVMDPVTKWEILQEGYLGRMYGVDMVTDNFRQKNLKVLDTGEVYITGAPINLGVLSVRGNMVTEPINRFPQGEAKKGWFLDQITSMVVANPMAISKGKKG